MTGRSGGSVRRQLRLALRATGDDEGGEGGSKMENGSGLGGSHRWGGGEETATAAFDGRKSRRGAAILTSKVGGLSHRRKGEAAACLSSGERERSSKGERDGGWCF
jgi:hypothetical protein